MQLTTGAKCLIVLVLFVILAAACVHLVHVYQRVMAKRPEIAVTIPPDSTIYDIDRILSSAGVIQQGALINSTSAVGLEGRLFPDTYDFYPSSTVAQVLARFNDDFAAKAEPLFAAAAASTTDPRTIENDLIVASMIQKEVASSTDEAIVAGIIDKRLAANMSLDIDATICYIKQQAGPTSTVGCYPLTSADFADKSPYNTYRYAGLPPAPIGNPGAQAILAALHPQTSTYWYYLSDPKTGQTIYAVTLAQQNANSKKYLGE